MGRKKVEKGNRQVMQKKIFDELQYDENNRLKDSYDYIMDCLETLEEMKNPERIFSRVMKQKMQEFSKTDENGQSVKPKVEDYVEEIAERLTESTPALALWNAGEVWHPPLAECGDGTSEMDRAAVRMMWKKTVKEWWDEDSFPFLNDRSYRCDRRDVVLFFLITMGFTVKESDAFLNEMSLVKDRDFVRPLYALDFKECLFRWILLWNENHDAKISYQEACEYYLQYGDWLLKTMHSNWKSLCANIDSYICGALAVDPQAEQIEEMREVKANCVELLEKIPKDAKALYSQGHAENLKRFMALTTHAERKLERVKAKAESRKMMYGDDHGLVELRHYNEHTRVNRGTEYAWMELSRAADGKQESFAAGFEKFKATSLGYIGEAHWSQFSQLIRLFIRSEETKRERTFRDVQEAFANLQRTNLSFAFDGWEIRNILKQYTNTRGVLSGRLKPIRRQDTDAYEMRKPESSSALSQMLNRYHKWCTGKTIKKEEEQKGAHTEFKRENVMKVALAAGIETSAELQSVMRLAGSAEFQFLDFKEAVVYLMARYREEFLFLYEQVDDIVRGLVRTELTSPSKERDYEQLKSAIRSFPLELEIELPKEWKTSDVMNMASFAERKRMVRILDEWWGNAINDRIETTELSLVELIRKADVMTVLYYANRGKDGDPERIRTKLFYGPYTDDFELIVNKQTKRVGVEEQRDWLRIIAEMSRVMKRIFTEDGVKLLFSNAYFVPESCMIDEVMDIAEDNSVGINAMGAEVCVDLAELYCTLIQEEVFGEMEDVDAEDCLCISNEEITRILRYFGEVVKTICFIRQEIPAVETRYVLEQWSFILAFLDLAGVDVEEAKIVLNQSLHTWVAGIQTLQERKTQKI